MFLLSSLARDFAHLTYKRVSTNLSWLYVAFASGCTVRPYLWRGCEWSSARTRLAAGCQSTPQPASTSATVLLSSWKLHGSCGPMRASHCICPGCCQHPSLMSTFSHFLLLLQVGLFPRLLLPKNKQKVQVIQIACLFEPSVQLGWDKRWLRVVVWVVWRRRQWWSPEEVRWGWW